MAWITSCSCGWALLLVVGRALPSSQAPCELALLCEPSCSCQPQARIVSHSLARCRLRLSGSAAQRRRPAAGLPHRTARTLCFFQSVSLLSPLSPTSGCFASWCCCSCYCGILAMLRAPRVWSPQPAINRSIPSRPLQFAFNPHLTGRCVCR